MYECSECNYKTSDKSNFNKHMKSYKHKKSISVVEDYSLKPSKKIQDEKSKIVIKEKIIDINNFICDLCYCKFARLYNLMRHKTNCLKLYKEKKEIDANFDKKYFEEKLKLKDEQIKLLMKFPKLLEDRKTITNNYISVINFVQQNYVNAPSLKQLNDYSKVDLGNDIFNKLTYAYKNNFLEKYLGDLLIGWYKKEDPSQQSLWNSDVTRLNYVVKELMANNKSNWSMDKKGIKTKEYIIHPLLVFIKKIISKYLQNIHNLVSKSPYDDLLIIMENAGELSLIKKDIETGILSEEIIKYLAPHFSFEKNNLLKI